MKDNSIISGMRTKNKLASKYRAEEGMQSTQNKITKSNENAHVFLYLDTSSIILDLSTVLISVVCDVKFILLKIIYFDFIATFRCTG